MIPENEPLSADDLRAMIADGAVLQRVPAVRIAFIQAEAQLLFFVDGECVELKNSERATVELLCRERHYHADLLAGCAESVWPLLQRMLARGALMLLEEE